MGEMITLDPFNGKMREIIFHKGIKPMYSNILRSHPLYHVGSKADPLFHWLLAGVFDNMAKTKRTAALNYLNSSYSVIVGLINKSPHTPIYNYDLPFSETQSHLCRLGVSDISYINMLNWIVSNYQNGYTKESVTPVLIDYFEQLVSGMVCFETQMGITFLMNIFYNYLEDVELLSNLIFSYFLNEHKRNIKILSSDKRHLNDVLEDIRWIDYLKKGGIYECKGFENISITETTIPQDYTDTV